MSLIFLPTKKYEIYLQNFIKKIKKETHIRESSIGINVELVCVGGGKEGHISEHLAFLASLVSSLSLPKPFMMFPRYGLNQIRRL